VLRTLPVALATVVAALSIVGCAGNSSDTSPTVGPLSAGSNPPPSASNGSAVLNWTPVTSDTTGQTLLDLAGYEIHYGNSQDALPYLIVVNDSQQTTYTIPGLATGTWFFSVNAYTTSGVEGLPSNVASKTIN
jgi:hypothetical protein